MTDADKKKPASEPNDPPDPIEGRHDKDETGFPRKNTEQNREMRPGALTREEIRERTHHNKE